MWANFLSRETYCDILLSTHFAVILICYYRDCFPESPCLLNRTWSDCCEEVLQKWTICGNHHVYPYGQMYRNVSHMIRLRQIQADDNAPAFAKAHIKQELYPAMRILCQPQKKKRKTAAMQTFRREYSNKYPWILKVYKRNIVRTLHCLCLGLSDIVRRGIWH